MDTQPLPLVSFGKYEGQPITTLINDTNYFNFLKNQEWFKKKYPIIYNICLNQTITTNNQNEKTPEHNKLQNLFLDETNQIKLLNLVLGKIGRRFKEKFELLISDKDFLGNFDNSTLEYWVCGEKKNSYNNQLNNSDSGWILPEFNSSLKDSNIIFEDVYNWDFILYYDDCQTIRFETNYIKKNEKTKEYLYNILEKYDFIKDNFSESPRVLGTWIHEKECKIENKYSVSITAVAYDYMICCELKPILGDDYPCVLRKLKTQINLIKNDRKFEESYCIFILIIGSFTSIHTTKEQLITIFKQSKIKIIFTDKIFESSKLVEIENKDTEQLLSEKKISEENITLQTDLLQTKEQLIQAEEKIRKLEEEIILLKNKKQTKNIRDYFGKK